MKGGNKNMNQKRKGRCVSRLLMIMIVFFGLVIAPMFSGLWGGMTIVSAKERTIAVTGRFTYSGGLPIRNARVIIWDADEGFDDKKAEGYTDNNGYYYFSDVSNHDYSGFGHKYYGIDVYARCYARNDWAVNVMDNPDWIPDILPGNDGETYSFRTETLSGVASWSNVDLGWVDAGDRSQAFNVFNVISSVGYPYLQSMGITPPKVTVFYDDWFIASDSYHCPKSIPNLISSDGSWSWLKTILFPQKLVNMGLAEAAESIIGPHIKNGQGRNDGTVLHEYGHYIMDTYADFYPPFTVLSHKYFTTYNAEHAMGEGWAHFFSAAARQWAGYPAFGNNGYRSTPFDIETNSVGGASVEASVASALWDIINIIDPIGGTSERVDQHYWGLAVWDVLVNYDPDPGKRWPDGKDHPWTIYDIYNGFRTRHPEYIQGIWSIYQLNKINIDDPYPPTNPTSYILHSPQGVKPTGRIDISWSGADDQISGVAGYSVVVDNNPGTIPDTSINFTGNYKTNKGLTTGNWYIHVRACDCAGNWADGAFHAGPFHVQALATAITSYPEFTGINKKTFISPGSKLKIIAEDKSNGFGISKTYYRLSNGTYSTGWQTTSNTAIPLDKLKLRDDQYTLEYYSVDKSGNKEEMKTISLFLDNTPTKSKIILGEPKYISNNKYIADNTPIKLSASDASSGINKTYYRIWYNTGWTSWLEYSSDFILPENGKHYIEYYSVDNNGNVEETNNQSLYVDDIPPHAEEDSAIIQMDSNDNQLNVLSNDNDMNNLPCSIISVTQPAHGKSSTNGLFCYYTPTPLYHGSDSFTYAIRNTLGTNDTANVTLQVSTNEAEAGEQYQGFVNTEITFNGSRTRYPDGNIITWFWNFDDNTTNGTGKITKHTYLKPGIYNVTLTFIDDKGAAHTNTMTCVIIQPNRPPTTPIITGPTHGTKNTMNTYIAESTDVDNDQLQYSFNWGDNVIQSSDFPPKESGYILNHSWTAAGRYDVTATVTDDQTESSSTIMVYIDAAQTGEIGYLLDNNSDGRYDAFYSDALQQTLTIQEKDDGYTIDSDGDGTWDYAFDEVKGLTTYQPPQPTPGFELILILGALMFMILWKRKKSKR